MNDRFFSEDDTVITRKPSANAEGRGNPGRGFRVAFLGEISKRPTPSFGGTGINLIRLGNALVQNGLDVHVIMAHRSHLDSYGECLHPAVTRIAIGRRKRIFQIAALVNYLVRWRPAFLVTQDSRAMDLAVAASRLLRRPPRLVCVIHNERVVRAEGDTSKERRKLRRFRRVAAHADALVAVSPGLISAIEARVDLGGIPVTVIPSTGYPHAAMEAARAAPVPRPDSARPHLLCVARLSAQKDQATLLRAFALVRNRGVDACLTLLGEGADRSMLEATVRELGLESHVRMPGFVANPIAYMADADALVVSSVQEAFGLVIVEALAVGLPVVSTDCPYGPRFILEDGKHGHLVPIGNAEAMAEAIVDTIRHRPDPEELIKRARDFDSAAIGARYMALFNALAEGRASLGVRGLP